MKNVRLEVYFVLLDNEYHAVFDRMFWGQKYVYRLMGPDGIPFTKRLSYGMNFFGSTVVNDAFNILDFLKFINGFQMFPVSEKEFPRIVSMFQNECGLRDGENEVYNLTDTYDYENDY